MMALQAKNTIQELSQAEILKKNDRKRIRQLGFDSRFKYPNVSINHKYHIVQVKRPLRTIMDFNPEQNGGCGLWGQNFSYKFDHSDHKVIDTSLKSSLDLMSTKFSNLEKRDRPFSKNAHRLQQVVKEALYLQKSGQYGKLEMDTTTRTIKSACHKYSLSP